MKQASIIKPLQRLFFLAAFLYCLCTPAALLAQADSTAVTDTAVTEAETTGADLIAPSIELITVQKGDNSIDLKAALKAKVKGTFYKLPLLKITFIQVTDTAEKVLGFLITDNQGKAVFHVKPEALTADNEGKVHFKAVFAGNKAMEATEEEVTIKRARLEITPVKEDSVYTVNVKLVDIVNGTETPVKETVIGVFVARLFNPLKVGEGTTDESGEAAIEFPAHLPGDAKGNLTLLAKLDENETYGNLETAVVQQWGVPVSDKIQDQPRALWSSHPPLWMLITFIVLMVAVWGHYIVIVYELFRLRKEQPHAPAEIKN